MALPRGGPATVRRAGEDEDEDGEEEEEKDHIAELMSLGLVLASVGVCFGACQATSSSAEAETRLGAASCVYWAMVVITVLSGVETLWILGDGLVEETMAVV